MTDVKKTTEAPKLKIGGFSGDSDGEISDSYSLVKVKVKRKTAGGFVGNNRGCIQGSFSFTALDGHAGGFAAHQGAEETITDSYFFHAEKEGSGRLKTLSDNALGQRLSDIKKAQDLVKLGFDLEEIWEYIPLGQDKNDRSAQADKTRKAPLRFMADNWWFDIRKTEKIKDYLAKHYLAENKYCDEDGHILPPERIAPEALQGMAITIETAAQLREWAKKVNDGDEAAAGAYVRLTKDIDVGGQAWQPIGNSRTKAFTGLFDGEGHTLTGIVIRDRKLENKGFFGFLEGEVYNLSVDVKMAGSASTINAGALAAVVLEKGVIGCCGAVVNIRAAGKQGAYGGLAGRVNGRIIRSYAAGKLFFVVIPFWYSLPLVLLFIPFLPTIISLIPSQFIPAFNSPAYPPPLYDEDQVRIDNLRPTVEGNFVSFQFEQEVDVSLSTGACQFNFRNPGNSKHDIILHLQFTDAQAIRLMGGTGRSEEEQAALEESDGYDPASHRTVIGESLAIRPGFGLEQINLTDFAMANLPPGNYNAIVYLVFHEATSHERAMLESQLPVILNVHE